MFTPRWLPEADASYTRLKAAAKEAYDRRQKSKRNKSSKAEGLFKQVHKTIMLLCESPRHPSLQTHQYLSIENPYNPGEKVFEAYVRNNTPGAYRVFWCYGPAKAEITIIAITPHP